MARREVIEVTCDRCGKVETQTTSELRQDVSSELAVTFHEETVSFGDLCRRCRVAVDGYFKKLVKKAEEEKSPESQPEKKSSRLFSGK